MSTIKELRKLIKGLPSDMNVILASDPEGNGHSFCYVGEVVHYTDDSDAIHILDDDADIDEYENVKMGLLLCPEN